MQVSCATIIVHDCLREFCDQRQGGVNGHLVEVLAGLHRVKRINILQCGRFEIIALPCVCHKLCQFI